MKILITAGTLVAGEHREPGEALDVADADGRAVTLAKKGVEISDEEFQRRTKPKKKAAASAPTTGDATGEAPTSPAPTTGEAPTNPAPTNGVASPPVTSAGVSDPSGAASDPGALPL